jgi:hypothetical protein
VEEILNEIFDLDTSGSEREAIEETWKEYLSPEEMAAEFAQAVNMIEGYLVAAETIGPAPSF